MKYQIISDGSCDLAPDVVKENNLKIVPFYVSFDDKNYYKEIEELGIRDFYQRLIDNPGVYPKSSLPSVQDYIDAFTPYVKAGTAVICICITQKFSGSFGSATNARQVLLEQYPDARITVIDAMCNTVLQGQLVLEAVRMQKAGMDYDAVVANLERIRPTGRIIFTIGSVDYLKAGGRIGKIAGIVGTNLRIKPIITLKEGGITPSGVAISREKSKQRVIAQVKQYFEEIQDTPDHYSLRIGFGYDIEEAIRFEKELVASLSSYSSVRHIKISQIGATIGVHTGPHPIGVGLLKKYDV